jgi:hypothetical protein
MWKQLELGEEEPGLGSRSSRRSHFVSDFVRLI